MKLLSTDDNNLCAKCVFPGYGKLRIVCGL